MINSFIFHCWELMKNCPIVLIEPDAYSSPSMGSGHHTNLFSADDDDYSGSVSSLGSCEVRAVPTAVLKTTTAEKSATMGTRTSWSSNGRFVDSLASDNDSTSGERMTAAKGKMKKFESSSKINSGRLLNNPISRLLYAQ